MYITNIVYINKNTFRRHNYVCSKSSIKKKEIRIKGNFSFSYFFFFLSKWWNTWKEYSDQFEILSLLIFIHLLILVGFSETVFLWFVIWPINGQQTMQLNIFVFSLISSIYLTKTTNKIWQYILLNLLQDVKKKKITKTIPKS